MKKIFLLLFSLMALLPAPAGGQNPLKSEDNEFFSSSEARRIGGQVLLWQRNTGGWPKNVDMAKPLSDADRTKVLADKSKLDDSTIDNNATTIQMYYLARLYSATKDKSYRDSFRKGLQYIFEGQYPNGGWPQFWPEVRVRYARHITFNDRAMENVMNLLLDIYEGSAPFNAKGLVTKNMKNMAKKAFDKGIECILDCQIIVDGQATVWCQQHDEYTLKPAKARSFELASYCSTESAGLLELLMKLKDPSDRVKNAINGGMAWFEANKILGYKYIHADGDAYIIPHTDAKPLWARFYDFEECKPFFCGRDGIMRRNLSEIEQERRGGYGWYTEFPGTLYKKYAEWSAKYDPAGRAKLRPGKTAIHLMGDSTMAPKDTSKGNPERGWGMYFEEYFDSSIIVFNYARNGRSTKRFIDEGRWESVKESLIPGDYVLIQFGHNDQKKDDPKRYAPAWSAYQDNLRLFIREARSLGAIPVLLTPVARRKFVDGVFDGTVHGDYPAAMKAVAEETGTALIDMTSATNDWIRAAGYEASIPYFLWVEPGTVEAFPEGKRDNTHSTEIGARRNCEIVRDSIMVKLPALAEHLR